MNTTVEALIGRYAEAWSRHDVDAILELHTDDAVFENHTSGGLAVGKAELRRLVQGVFGSFPDLRFETRRAYFGDHLAVVEWTATATHERAITWGGRSFGPSGKTLVWDGLDVMPIRDGLVARKDVYADSISFLRQAGVPMR